MQNSIYSLQHSIVHFKTDLMFSYPPPKKPTKANEHKEIWGDSGYVQYFGCGDDITICAYHIYQDVYIKCVQFLYINYTSMQFQKE